MTLEPRQRERFQAALRAAGMPGPEAFSVAPAHQIVSAAMLADIAGFIRVFDAVTGREAWRAAALSEAPAIARRRRREVCFFSAWDFHCPPEGGFALIEFNDNGSGFLFAAIVNALYYEAAGLARDASIASPIAVEAFRRAIGEMAEREAAAFLGRPSADMALILDDSNSLAAGKFRLELSMLRNLLRERGWRACLGSPGDTRWEGGRLTFERAPVAFVVNRSTDFFFAADAFAALRDAYAGEDLYVAPNPFTYATRSDKRLLEWLSLPDWDGGLGVEAAERRVLSAHTPETRLVGADNAESLAQAKRDLVFKPLHGFAGRGLLDSAVVGRERLRRLVKRGEGYVAQKRVAKPSLEVDGAHLWRDLRVWAYRGKIVLLSGRASTRPDRLDLTAPGGWLPTYAAR